MQMLATFPKPRTYGFTLIEMMVVLLIVGLLVSVLSPSMQRMANTIQAKTEFLEVKRRLSGLSALAMERGEAIHIKELDLEEGWIIFGDVVYKPNGVCIGGDIRIAYKKMEIHRQQLTSPFCRLGDDDG